MTPVDLTPIYDAVRGNDPITVRKAVAGIAGRIDELEPAKVPEAVEVMSSLFYIDLGDMPEFVTVVEETVATIAAMGERAVPTLMRLMSETDLKANIVIGRTLGRIGPPAYGALKDLYYHAAYPWQRCLALFALAKMHEAALMEIFPDVVKALDDSDREVRDTAARTVGRIVDKFQPGQLPRDIVSDAFEMLEQRLQDFGAVIRAKAVRSIGKMARNNYLDKDQLEIAVESISNLLGMNGEECDPFFLVRKEAEEAMEYLERAIAS
jgi:HEAT repeat protein